MNSIVLVIEQFHSEFYDIHNNDQMSLTLIQVLWQMKSSNQQLRNLNTTKRYMYIIFRSYAFFFVPGKARKALNKVIVLPLPGGPQRTNGLCSANHVFSNVS